MVTITLEPDVAEQISYLASMSGEDFDKNRIVDRALRRYLAEFRREKIRRELEAFRQQSQTLLATYPYSQSYNPPAPTIEVSFVMATEMLRVGPLSALVDSGADGTIVPIKYLEEIHAPSTMEMTIRSQWGERHQVNW